MTRLSDAEAQLPPDGRCECGCRLTCFRLAYQPGWETQCDTDCECFPCPVCHPGSFEDDEDEDALRAYVSRQWAEDWGGREDSAYDTADEAP